MDFSRINIIIKCIEVEENPAIRREMCRFGNLPEKKSPPLLAPASAVNLPAIVECGGESGTDRT